VRADRAGGGTTVPCAVLCARMQALPQAAALVNCREQLPANMSLHVM
jgi:hypothetical protein